MAHWDPIKILYLIRKQICKNKTIIFFSFSVHFFSKKGKSFFFKKKVLVYWSKTNFFSEKKVFLSKIKCPLNSFVVFNENLLCRLKLLLLEEKIRKIISFFASSCVWKHYSFDFGAFGTTRNSKNIQTFYLKNTNSTLLFPTEIHCFKQQREVFSKKE